MSSHDDTRKGGRVYCIQAEDGGPVKIGVTTEPIHRRLSKIQTSSPVPLVVRRLIEFATYDEARQHERDMHQRFAEDRVGGEWFYPSLGVALFADVEPEETCPDAVTLDRWAGIADLWARGVTREVIADMLGRPQYALRREMSQMRRYGYELPFAIRGEDYGPSDTPFEGTPGTVGRPGRVFIK